MSFNKLMLHLDTAGRKVVCSAGIGGAAAPVAVDCARVGELSPSLHAAVDLLGTGVGVGLVVVVVGDGVVRLGAGDDVGDKSTPSNMFHHIVSYRRALVLILCTILFLEAQADSDICKICTCNSLTTNINCENRNLASIPQPIPTNAEYLNLENNHISTINEGAFTGLSNLKKISLTNNKISRVEKGMFQGLRRLQTLILWNNNISTIEEGVFTGLTNLKKLDLDGNKISTMKQGIFNGLSNLAALYLAHNNISTIKEGTFTGLSNLKSLYLHNNKISRIEKGMFQDLHSLQTLNLGANNISTIKHGIFMGFKNLKTLYLGANNISTIKHGIFMGLKNLKSLDLQSNNIATIKEGTFTKLSNLTTLYLQENKISSIEEEMFQDLHSLQYLNLDGNKISTMKQGIFNGLSKLTTIDLQSNNIATIKEGTFTGISILTTLDLDGNKISTMKQGIFNGLSNLTTIYLQDNPIEHYEDGAFLFLPSIVEIYLPDNNLRCGCHLPAFVNYIKKVYNRTVAVSGTCLEGSGKRIPILDYLQCQNYSLFQRNLQCQTCTGMKCTDLEVTSCPGAEPVCRFAISMNGVTMKTERSCSTYRKCVESMRNNTLTCNKRTNSMSCTGCCVGHLCNKNDFIGRTKSFVFRLIFKKFNEYKILAENISRAMERDLSTVTGTFRVEDCGSDRSKIFAIYCTVFSEMTESQLRRNISEVLNKSQALLNIGVRQSHMKFIDEMFCDESTSTNDGTFSWPMTKIGTTAEIPCHGNVATRHCSPRTVGHPEMASSQNLSSQKCSPFTGIWQEPDMSQCYNAEQTTQGLKDIENKGIDDGRTKSFVFRLILKMINERKIPAENVSSAMEHEFLTVTGKFRVEYPGVQSELRRKISQVLNKSQAFLNLGVQKSHTKFLDESSSTGNGTEDRAAETNF
ncbi:adhesion G-protein coupled receptor G6-like isoform X2 [Octopus vulgaris]|uniref:Adhesion G-protein coupled receptor G6-like isoform X2 n=1 Tax=Octopus vulgaris TaxID=6645 RepID=A0AA36FSA8_OCTVU|nr:adhesion G-protein coupled receptor G6-like isoform X2 [Octopus vulgaris]